MKPKGPCDEVIGKSAACAADDYCQKKDASLNAVLHNGHDTVELNYNNAGTMETVDIIGEVGTYLGNHDPRWRTAEGALITKDITIRRKSTVKHGVTTFDKSQWDVYVKDTVDGLGDHTISLSA